ncbi:MAG TPA: hypothetical protein DCQ08_02380 [Amoebophilaceae bacterium]|nr:hypothetical protein [Amoebophilaceae bacterium]
MQHRKKIEIKKKESQRSYLEDMQPPVTAGKETPVRKSFLISQALEAMIQTYIYQKRTQGDIYYNQTHLVRDALTAFLKKNGTNG